MLLETTSHLSCPKMLFGRKRYLGCQVHSHSPVFDDFMEFYIISTPKMCAYFNWVSPLAYMANELVNWMHREASTKCGAIKKFQSANLSIFQPE